MRRTKNPSFSAKLAGTDLPSSIWVGHKNKDDRTLLIESTSDFVVDESFCKRKERKVIDGEHLQ